jgi:hypothetical protein
MATQPILPAVSPDIKDLSELLEALRTRHTMMFYPRLILSAFGVLGIVGLLEAIFRVPP